MGIRVTTDGSVDCHSLGSIAACLCGRSMSEQDRAIALYQFVRRLMFHYPQRSERKAPDDLDAARLLNTYGYSFCSQQAIALVGLWQAAGIAGEIWSMPGHVTAHARYGGGLHWFDPLIGAYVYRRGGSVVASLPEIAADPTLLTRAVEEGRAPAGFLPCRSVLREDAERFCQHDPRYVSTCRGLGGDLAFLAALAADARPWPWGRPDQPRYDGGATLRGGERVVFLWETLPGEANCTSLKPGQRPRANVVAPEELPPKHICGAAAERRDVLHYRYWQPYAKRLGGVRTCRYQANGRHVYRPDFARPPTRDLFERNTFVWRPPARGEAALRVRRKGTIARLLCRLRTPHVYTSLAVTAAFHRAAADDVSRICLSADRRRWLPVWDAARLGARRGKVLAEAKLRDRIVGRRELWIRLDCRTAGDPAKAGLADLKIEGVFQHNMFARPYLVPGRNRITVHGCRDDLPEGRGLTVTWVWQEGRTTRRHRRDVSALPASYVVETGGEATPRMVRLEIAAGR